jgi:ABC-type transport system substrate-binding protein
MRTVRRREAIKLLTAGAAAIAMPNITRAEMKPLRIRRKSDFASFDPAFCPNFEDRAVTAAILAPLLRYKARVNDTAIWETEPYLAAKWTVAAGGKDYALDLRAETWKDVRSTITSDDVASSFARFSQKKELPNAWFARDIAKIEVPDSTRTEVLLRSPVEALDTRFLATGYASILPKAKLNGHENENFGLAPPDHSGAYDIVGRPNDRLLLAANPNWAGAKPRTEQIELVVIPNEEDARSQRDRGEIDASEVPRDLTTAGSDPPESWRVSGETTGRIVYLALFPNGRSLRSADVRRGVQLSIDREALVRTVYGGQWAQPAFSFAPSGWVWRAESEAIESNPADAAGLLRELHAPLTLAFTQNHFPDPSALEEVAAFVANGLRKQGVEVNVSQIEAERLFGGESVNLDGLDMLVTRAPVWPLGVRDALARFSNAHKIGFDEIDNMNEEAQNEPTSELLRAIENRLIGMGALRVLVEERAVWGYNRSIIPFFGPDGGVANLASWARS